jgi:flagellar hook-associated protein 2
LAQFSTMESIVGSSTSMRESLKGTFEGMMNSNNN